MLHVRTPSCVLALAHPSPQRWEFPVGLSVAFQEHPQVLHAGMYSCLVLVAHLLTLPQDFAVGCVSAFQEHPQVLHTFVCLLVSGRYLWLTLVWRSKGTSPCPTPVRFGSCSFRPTCGSGYRNLSLASYGCSRGTTFCPTPTHCLARSSRPTYCPSSRNLSLASFQRCSVTPARHTLLLIGTCILQ